MKTYKVTATYTVYCETEIEAENKDQAYQIAREMDGGDFKQSNELGDWHINDIQEIEQ